MVFRIVCSMATQLTALDFQVASLQFFHKCDNGSWKTGMSESTYFSNLDGGLKCPEMKMETLKLWSAAS